MRNKPAERLVPIVAAIAVLASTAGCRVENHKDGDNDNVKIATPFGGMSVKTNDAVVQSNVGLSIYPGATLVRKDKDSGAADVNMNFGSFHLGVKALSYRSDDAPDKVIGFYRKDMSRYGVVILCKDHRAVGTPDRTGDGLGCDSESQGSVHTAAPACGGGRSRGRRLQVRAGGARPARPRELEGRRE